MVDGWRTFGVAEAFSVMGDGRCRTIKPNWWADGLAGLLTTLAPHYGPEGVLVLDISAARLLGLPTEPVPNPGIDHPVLEELTRAGWNHPGRLSDWTRCWAPDRPTIFVCVEPMLDTRHDAEGFFPYSPFLRSEFWDTVRTLDLWHRASGVPWRGVPGMAGMAIMERYAPKRVDSPDPAKRRYAPMWKPSDRRDKVTNRPIPWGPDGACENRYELTHWRNMPTGQRCWIHGFDQNRSYIAAAMLCEVAPGPLHHTGRIAFSKRLAGWWQVELAPWNLAGRLPDPAGYIDGEDPTRPRIRWITTQRLTLLEELTEEGVYGGVRIVDSWTAPARDTVLRPFAERVRDMYMYKDPAGQLIDGLPVIDQIKLQEMTKEVGRRTLGMLNAATNWAYRPDWWYAIVALQAANLWRHAWKVGKADDRWPVGIDVDNVFYAHTSKDPREAAPPTFICRNAGRGCCDGFDETGYMLGHYKPHGAYRWPRPARRKAA